MTILDLIKQCEIRLDYLNILKISQIQHENHDMVNKIDSEIIEIEATIAKLKGTN